MRARAERRPLAASVAVNTVTALPDGWFDAYRWLRRLTPSTDVAEELTVEVCRRLRSGHPAWLASAAVDVRLRFFVVQIMLEHRGVLVEAVNRRRGRKDAGSAKSAAAEIRHALPAGCSGRQPAASRTRGKGRGNGRSATG